MRHLTRIGEDLRRDGFLLSPLETESVLDARPTVAASRAIGVTWQQRPVAVAFAVPHAGETLDAAAVRGWCAKRLAGYNVPMRTYAVPALPTAPSANGATIQRANLREQALELPAGEG